MAEQEPERRPARPLYGYRDLGSHVRHGRANVIRAWIILALLALGYLAWTLIIYFFEPGLR
ncbi:MAG: hypothetical protein ACJ75G_10455 [Gaiellaceae bacterium]|jgi:hypothetical protein